MTAESKLRIVEEALTAETLASYAEVPIAFRVESYLRVDVISNGLSGLRLVEVPVQPYTKDYDFDPGKEEGPIRWLRWRSANSAFLVAFEGNQRVASAVLLSHVEGMGFLRGRTDMAALWDIRVAPEARGRGVGTVLFRAAVGWAGERGYRRLKIETQNINVAACHFYARMGCYLGGFERHAYEDLPDEVQLIWYYDLS